MRNKVFLMLTFCLRGVICTQCEPQNITNPEHEPKMPIPKFYILRPKGFGLKFPIAELDDDSMFVEVWYRLNTPINRTFLIDRANYGGFRSTGCNFVYEKKNFVFKDTDVLYFFMSVVNLLTPTSMHHFRVFCRVDLSEYICNMKNKIITKN